jgi:hypothetical protein
MSEQPEYEIERKNNVEYVIVRCPHGHLSRGMKVAEMKLRLSLTCTNTKCNAPWTALIPSIMELEAIP